MIAKHQFLIAIFFVLFYNKTMNIKEIAIYLKNYYYNSQQECIENNAVLSGVSSSKYSIPELETIDIEELKKELQQYNLNIDYANKLPCKKKIYNTKDSSRVIVYQNINDL